MWLWVLWCETWMSCWGLRVSVCLCVWVCVWGKCRKTHCSCRIGWLRNHEVPIVVVFFQLFPSPPFDNHSFFWSNYIGRLDHQGSIWRDFNLKPSSRPHFLSVSRMVKTETPEIPSLFVTSWISASPASISSYRGSKCDRFLPCETATFKRSPPSETAIEWKLKPSSLSFSFSL